MGQQADGHALGGRTFASAGVVLAGAVAYAILVGADVVAFTATPLCLGIIAIAAGLAGIRPKVVATGLVLACWGVAVLLVDHKVVPAARTTPAYMLGIGIGLLAASHLAPRAQRGDWLASAVVVAVTGPLSLYVAYDISAFGRWPLWSLVLAGWAAWEGLSAWRSTRTVVTSAPR